MGCSIIEGDLDRLFMGGVGDGVGELVEDATVVEGCAFFDRKGRWWDMSYGWWCMFGCV